MKNVLTPREAAALQEESRGRVARRGSPRPRLVAGADVSVVGDRARAAVVVLTFPALERVETRTADARVRFPYLPGLLAFREIPILLKAFRRLSVRPDLVLVDGHGLAHPRRFGLACHLGVLLDLPSIGCAKSLFVGEHAEPAAARGSWTSLVHQGQTVGAAVRTRDATRVIYVSIGHKVSLGNAIRLTLACAPRYRIPEPTRLADQAASLRR